MIDQTFRIKALKDKFVPQNMVVTSKLYFSYSEKHFLIVRLWIRLLIMMRLATERNNLMRLHGWDIPYTWVNPTIFAQKFKSIVHQIQHVFQNVVFR